MKTILITGASSGIGQALLARLQEEGSWKAVTVSRRDVPVVNADHHHYSCDLSVPGNVAALAELIETNHGPFDAIVNAAGAGYFAPAHAAISARWQETVALNLFAPFDFIRACLPRMCAKGAGRIVNISSDADSVGFADATAYCASKAALTAMSSALRKELVGTGVTVTVISPGRVDTSFNGKKPGERPLSLQPDDVVHVIMGVLDANSRCEIEIIRLRSNLEAPN